jgi:hypothetical protein
MNVRAQLAIAAIAFALGAWCARPSTSADASPQHRDTGVPPVPPANSSSASGAQPSTAQSLFQNDPSDDRWSALVSCLQEPAYFRRRAELAERLADATSADIAAHIARAESLPGKFQDMILYSLVSRWFEVDPAAAAEWVREKKAPRFLEIWASHDRTAAMKELIVWGGWSEFGWRLGNVDPIVGNTPLERATAWAELPPSEARDRHIAAALWGWNDPQAAISFAERLPPSAVLADFQRGALTRSEIDPARHLPLATKFAAEARPGLNGNTFATQFAVRLAAQDPATARQWIGSLPDGLRPAATLGVAREWAQADAVAALEWTRAQGHDVARNLYTDHTYATGTVLSRAIAAHPERTATWLLAQPPSEQRDAWIETAAVAGLAPLSPERREKAARTWLRELHSAMPEESRARLAKKLGPQAALLR